MEPVELIVAALAAGAAGGAENVASTVVKDAYQELKRLVTARCAGRKTAKVALADHEADPEAGRASLEQALTESGAAADAELIDAARRLLAMLSKSNSAGGKYTVTVENTQGTHVGEFGSKPPSGPAEVDDGVPVRERRASRDGRAASAEVDDGVPVRERRVPRDRRAASAEVDDGVPVRERRVPRGRRAASAEVDDGVPVRERWASRGRRAASAEVDDGVPVRERWASRGRRAASAEVDDGVPVRERWASRGRRAASAEVDDGVPVRERWASRGRRAASAEVDDGVPVRERWASRGRRAASAEVDDGVPVRERWASRGRRAASAEVDDGVPVRERWASRGRRAASAEVDDGVPVRERWASRDRTSYSSRVPTGISGPDRVILIERSRGVQVGRDNDQFSVYQVTLPSTAFRSGHALANQLMSPDTPWSRDLFRHDARPDFGRATGGTSGSSSGGVIQGPRGDTLIIVRNSSGVQIGDHGTQRNEFRIRVSDVTVRADGLAMNRERQVRIARLRENPRDQAAARWLARDVGRVAQDGLRADITARVKAVVDRPQINRWSGRVYGRMGAQVGGPHNRVRQEIDVVVSRFDTRGLERQILNRAARLSRSSAIRNERRDSRHSARGDRGAHEPDFWNTRGQEGTAGPIGDSDPLNIRVSIDSTSCLASVRCSHTKTKQVGTLGVPCVTSGIVSPVHGGGIRPGTTATALPDG